MVWPCNLADYIQVPRINRGRSFATTPRGPPPTQLRRPAHTASSSSYRPLIIMLSIQQCATLACLLDVTIPKPGNVHRGADFEDMTFLDFVTSAVAIGPVMAQAPTQSIGKTVLQSIQATRAVTTTNTNLGIVLLLAPMASVAHRLQDGDDLQQSIAKSIGGLTADDSQLVYEAIRLAQPGGMQKTDEMDVHDAPPESLLDAMQFASDWDLIAKQYVTEFSDVIWLRTLLVEEVRKRGLDMGVIVSHLRMMSEHPDSLIRRKCGDAVANEAASRAARTLEVIEGTDSNDEDDYDLVQKALQDLDFWLRSDGNRRNPGTTADLITAAMFIGLTEKSLQLR